MKVASIAILLLVFVSCTKPKINSPIVGFWSLDSVYAMINGGEKWEAAVSSPRASLIFSNDGSFTQIYTLLRNYNHFELISNDSLRFYNSKTNDELKVRYTLDHQLTIYYHCIACGEKYKRY